MADAPDDEALRADYDAGYASFASQVNRGVVVAHLHDRVRVEALLERRGNGRRRARRAREVVHDAL